jgi:starch synthase
MPRCVALFPWGDVIEEFLDPIGLTLDDFAQRMTGGWLFGYVAALQSAGWRAVIVCASARVDVPTVLRHAGSGAAIHAVPGRRCAAEWGSSQRAKELWRGTPWCAFAAVLRAERCDAILAQEYEYARFDALAAMSLRLRLPLFAVFQGGDRTLSPIEGRVRRWSLRRCSGLIVASARERERLAGAYARLALRVAPIANPLDCEEWQASPRDQARAALGLPRGDDVLLVINHGRIDIHRKGLDVLLDAWRRFSAQRPRVRLQLIGSGHDHAAFERLLAEAALPSITWQAAYLTDRAELRRWLSAADVYVTTSRTEGMPVAPLEAMACGLPVVSSCAQGLPDIFEHGERSGGIVVPCADAAATAGALERLAASAELRAQLGAAALRTVRARFSVEAVGRQLADFIGRDLASSAA